VVLGKCVGTALVGSAVVGDARGMLGPGTLGRVLVGGCEIGMPGSSVLQYDVTRATPPAASINGRNLTLCRADTSAVSQARHN
jgi:hypothetical protein